MGAPLQFPDPRPGHALDVPEPLEGRISSRAAAAIAGDVEPFCFRVAAVRFRFDREKCDAWTRCLLLVGPLGGRFVLRLKVHALPDPRPDSLDLEGEVDARIEAGIGSDERDPELVVLLVAGDG